ncbi:RlpA-like double-psi beta-barrel-protein domain-containing protein-containing protein, partial [Fennellomyces sp. T-0311]
TGTGTFFTPSTEGGSTGACGDFNEDDAEIVALVSNEFYGDSSSKSDWCGKKVEITVDGKSATATITDMCPECKTGDLDMTKAVFQQLGDLETGELDISWK